MQPKQLQYFITAYATKNIQRAAEKLFVSRQGISKTIRELEQELGADLFLRSSKGKTRAFIRISKRYKL